MNWNDLSVRQPLPRRAANTKHFHVVVVCLKGLEPVDIGKGMRVVAEV
jgi:hypothetical protein